MAEMMDADLEAMSGYGAAFEVETTLNANDWVRLGHVKGMTRPDEETEQGDATHMESEDGYREFISLLTDGGSVSVTLNYLPGGDTDDYVRGWRAARARRRCRMIYPNAVFDLFKGNVTNYGGEVSVDAVMESELTLKVAGAVSQGLVTT
ncbi:MAG: phage tail tube protein [Phenylobacterium sp.]|nr:phage tail tube protein [Phenylobacterium sp.]